MYYGLKESDIEYICESIKEFYEVKQFNVLDITGNIKFEVGTEI